MQAPKRKTSKSKRNMRRAHDSLTVNSAIVCPNCGEYTLPHRVCKSCKTYRQRTFAKADERVAGGRD